MDLKKSDLLIVPMKVVMRLSGRGKHYYCFFSKTFISLEGYKKWKMNEKIYKR